jgi:membrane protein implicated in regulation of membrane protease activity
MNVLLWVGVALVALWLAAWLVLKIAGLAVHLILLAAVALIAYAVVRRTWRKLRPGGPPPA